MTDVNDCSDGNNDGNMVIVVVMKAGLMVMVAIGNCIGKHDGKDKQIY